MANETQPGKSVEELVEKFKGLVSKADAIREQMKELTRQIEARTGQSIGLKSSHEIDVPDEKLIRRHRSR